MTSYLLLDGTAGGYAFTASHPDLDFGTGRFEVRVAVALDNWSGFVVQSLAARGEDSSVLDQSYAFDLDNDALFPVPQLRGRAAENLISYTQVSTAGITVTDGDLLLLRWVFDPDDDSFNRISDFYTKSSTPEDAYADLEDNTGWTALGTTVTTSPNINVNSPNANFYVGTQYGGGSPSPGKFYAVIVRNGTPGINAAVADFSSLAVGTTSFVDETGKTWELAGSAEIASDQVLDPPAGINCTGLPGAIVVEWDLYPEADTFNVYRAETEEGPFTLVSPPVTLLGWLDTEPAPGESFCYYVTAVSSVESEPSEIVCCTASAAFDFENPNLTPVDERVARPTHFKELGCGHYRVVITQRGGSPILTEPAFTAVYFGRRLDDSSSATVEISVEAAKNDPVCCAALADLEPFRHEVNVYRDNELIWVGPVHDVTYDADKISIACKDLISWFDRRIIETDFGFREDVADIFERLADAALARDNSPNIRVHTKRTGLIVAKSYLATDRIIAGDAMRELGNLGLDFTAVGRKIYTGGIEISFPRDLRVWQPSIRTMHIVKTGSEMANEVFVTGTPPGNSDTTLYGTATSRSDSYYGLIQAITSRPSDKEEEALDALARSRLEFLHQPPLYITASFAPESPFGINDLIPGIRCDVRLEQNCLKINQVMRLQSLSVSAVATAQGGVSESINATITPLGAEENS